MLRLPWFFWLSFFSVVAIFGFALWSATRSGASYLGRRTRRQRTLEVAAPARQALQQIIRYAQAAGYKVVALQEDEGLLVLDEPLNWVSWGFFLPVRVAGLPGGLCRVEVGIRSKVFQVGPVVTRSHERFVTGLQAALFAEGLKT
ncbi:hypothetical protein [Ideonella livida]|uniref:DUF1499 domain-containing protein n=1 Tax=Ideonella livida TaxID=2707176 RepID=A0A7C9PI73_9BURK|nr:hypothetical protein [Ideonella livida]NDY92449.1 hypothetical protein [Ideonella livida]